MSVSEREMLDLLHHRYGTVYGGARRYTLAEHVGDYGANPGRIADLIVVDAWGSGGYAFHGHEVKVSRSDWLAELRAPEKAEVFRRHMDYWWFVVPDAHVIRPGELPPECGLLVGTRKLRAAVNAPKQLSPEPIPRAMLASMFRAAAKTACRQPEVVPLTVGARRSYEMSAPPRKL